MRTVRSRFAAITTTVLLGLGGAVVLASPAQAVAPTVTSLQDSGPGSLRQAILDVNAGADANNTIHFTLIDPQPWVILLDSSLPNIEKSVTITGPGAGDLTIRRSAAMPGGEFFSFRPTSAGQNLVISDLTIAGGGAKNGPALESDSTNEDPGSITLTRLGISDLINSTAGGAVDIADLAGPLVVDDVVLTANTSSVAGGGIRVSSSPTADITINSSDFSGNVATIGNGGAVVVNEVASFVATGSTFANNTALGPTANGGALSVENVATTTTLVGNTFTSNAAGQRGGGAYLQGGTQATVTSGTFTTNSADSGGGLNVHDVDNLLTLQGAVTFTDNHAAAGGGGGLAVVDAATLAVQLIGKSVFTGNDATGSGGAVHVDNYATFTANDTTFSGNEASGGGAIFSSPDFDLPRRVVDLLGERSGQRRRHRSGRRDPGGGDGYRPAECHGTQLLVLHQRRHRDQRV